jgi:hypothetical protein
VTKRTVWILTYEVNDYNQEGEYFLAAFDKKPDHQKLAEALRGASGVPNDIMSALALLEHILKGGGRRGDENHWYGLEEVEAR